MTGIGSWRRWICSKTNVGFKLRCPRRGDGYISRNGADFAGKRSLLTNTEFKWQDSQMQRPKGSCSRTRGLITDSLCRSPSSCCGCAGFPWKRETQRQNDGEPPLGKCPVSSCECWKFFSTIITKYWLEFCFFCLQWSLKMVGKHLEGQTELVFRHVYFILAWL